MEFPAVFPLVVVMLSLPVLFIATVLGFILWRLVKNRRVLEGVREQTRAWAHAHGWGYADEVPGLHEGLTGGPFGRGASRTSAAVTWGTYAGRDAAAWHYSYVTSSGDSRQVHHRHVVALEMPAALPRVELRAESAVAWNAGDDIVFEDEAFNNAWHVRAADHRLAYDIVHPRLMERLMGRDLLGVNILYERERLFLWRRGLPEPAAVDSGLRILHELVGYVPEYVWQDASRRG